SYGTGLTCMASSTLHKACGLLMYRSTVSGVRSTNAASFTSGDVLGRPPTACPRNTITIPERVALKYTPATPSSRASTPVSLAPERCVRCLAMLDNTAGQLPGVFAPVSPNQQNPLSLIGDVSRHGDRMSRRLM